MAARASGSKAAAKTPAAKTGTRPARTRAAAAKPPAGQPAGGKPAVPVRARPRTPIQPVVPAGAPGYISDGRTAQQQAQAALADAPSPLDPSVFDFEPVRLDEITDETPVDEGPRIPLFYIGDKAYTVPSRPRMQLGFEMSHLTRTQGLNAAYDYLMTEMLGREGWEAWLEYRGRITAQQMGTIIAVCERLAVGAIEVPKAANG